MRLTSWLAQLLRTGEWLLREKFVPRMLWPVGFLRSHRQIVSFWPAPDAPLGTRVVLFCHFDRAGKVRDHTLNYLAALREAGLSIVMVSNSGHLRPESIQRLQLHCSAVVVRRNVGYDFGAWRDTMERMELPRPDTQMLLLANDSVYGPLRPLHDMIDRIDLGRADAWGATDSWQSQFHLQSYFLALGPRVFDSRTWRDFWAGVRPVPSKKWVIRHYEIGLSQRLIADGLRLDALWPYAQLVERAPAAPPTTPSIDCIDRSSGITEQTDPIADARRLQTSRILRAVAHREPLNPTSDLWRQLLAAGFPFIKRELLRDNPSGVSDVADWRAVIARDLQADIGAIETDLRRTLRNRAP